MSVATGGWSGCLVEAPRSGCLVEELRTAKSLDWALSCGLRKPLKEENVADPPEEGLVFSVVILQTKQHQCADRNKF